MGHQHLAVELAPPIWATPEKLLLHVDDWRSTWADKQVMRMCAHLQQLPGGRCVEVDCGCQAAACRSYLLLSRGRRHRQRQVLQAACCQQLHDKLRALSTSC